MDNRKKYNFDCFTITNYEKIVQLAISKGFSFIKHNDVFKLERKDVIWRHDVEFSPDVALKMAEIEANNGVQSTYFFQLHSEYYNLLERYFSDKLLKIKELGHEIGLHFDAHYYNINSEGELDRYITQDKQYFEYVFDLKLNTFSFHNTNSFILSCTKEKYGGLINVYSDFLKMNYQYCTDSTGFWRFEVLEDVLNDPNVQHLHVLTHDAMWSDEVLSPRHRVMNSIQLNAERIKRQYDEFFLNSKAQNIDY